MKIAVFDVPAERGGALTILEEYYKKASEDMENQWYFILSTPNFKETKNIKVINYPWVKRSWLHRLYFDIFVANKIVKKYGIDEIISLQNVIIKYTKVKQTLYLHQPLPFIEKRYKITENFMFWVYQNIISRIINKSIKKADCIIVQTNWMKNACIKINHINSNKIIVQPPNLNIDIKKKYDYDKTKKIIFFYPANALSYKNHIIIVEAVRLLKQSGIVDYNVIFTLKGDENKTTININSIVNKENLPISFIGQINLEEVYEYYNKSILLFPSYTETFGLPLLEAKLHSSPIIASSCAFSHEILDDYDKVQFFDPFDKNDLYQKMKELIENFH